MKFTIKHTCGHEREIVLFGKMTERLKKVEYLETLECPDCINAKRLEDAKNSELPMLVGSEKQIVWAHDIRKKTVELIESLKKKLEAHKDKPVVKKAFESFDKLLSSTDAKFWIDNRDELDTERCIAEFVEKMD